MSEHLDAVRIPMVRAEERPARSAAEHPNCFVCSPRNGRGLSARFVPSEDGAGVCAELSCGRDFEGYEGYVHGGIVCSLLDGAMASCLLNAGCVAHTASFTIRFRHPVVVGLRASVRAWRRHSRGRMHDMAAELVQDGRVKAEASARFIEQHVRQGNGGEKCQGETEQDRWVWDR